jgi:hypothetical protein
MKRTSIVAFVVIAGLVSGPAATAARPDLPAGCTSGSAAAAASRLVHPSAELSGRSTVAGFESALALKPLVYPGVRSRLIGVGEVWCNATGFNAAWQLADRPSDAVATASAFAQIAAAPYFDGISVSNARELLPGVVSLDTHAMTNGITATWKILTDASGIQHATWTATGFAVQPFVGEWEGITASPGVTRSYSQSSDGSVLPVEPLVPPPGAPEAVTEGRTADDFLIQIDYGQSGWSPNAGQDTGVHPVDWLRFIRKVTLENYQDFYNWGLRKNWTSNTGKVYVDSATAATCFACVFIREDFNIHISTAVVQVLFALGFEYPDDKLAFSNVIGHEMTHDWQNAYYKPTQNGASSGVNFAEGIARMQESIHGYSGVSHQPGSLIFSVGREAPGVSLAANSCNGWDGADREATFAAGPFTNKTYNACYFWLTWYPNHGTSAYVDLFAAMFNHVKKTGNAEIIDALNQASPGTFGEDLAAFAQASLTGKGYSWPAPGTTEPVRDWGKWLERFVPPVLETDQAFTKTLRDGGVMAREITSGGELTMTSTRPGVGVYVIRDDGTTATRTKVDTTDGIADSVAAPASGEKAWLVAVYPALGSTSVTLRLNASA